MVSDFIATQNVNFFRFLRPETRFGHQKGHQCEDALKSSMILTQKTTAAINGVEHQKTVKI